MKNYSVRGFTLIELLVVIAIIGVLSSIVLASLNTARNKGNDASIKSNLSNIRAQAEILNDGAGCYNNDGTTATGCTATAMTIGACSGGAAAQIFKNSNISAQILAAMKAAGATDLTSTTKGACAQIVNNGAWAVAVTLKSATTEAWCVDSTGASKQKTITADTPSGAITYTAGTAAYCN